MMDLSIATLNYQRVWRVPEHFAAISGTHWEKEHENHEMIALGLLATFFYLHSKTENKSLCPKI